MVDTTTLNESVRSPIDGTESVRLATTGANWRATLANIFAALGVLKTGDTMTGDLAISKLIPALQLKKTGGAGSYNAIDGFTGDSQRWRVLLGNVTAEGGGNSGSNFYIINYNDSGTEVGGGYPFFIDRASGLITIKGDPTAALGISTKQYVDAQRPRGFFAHKNGTNQTGIASAGYTKLTATTERFDHGGWYDAANSKWTPAAGIVFVAVAMVGNGNFNAGSGVLCTDVFKNGSRLFQSSAYAAVTGTQDISTNVGGFDVADGDDYYEWYTYPVLASGTLYCHGTPEISFFTGAWLGATP